MTLTTRRAARAGLALASAVGLAAFTATSAMAYDWKTNDTDNIERATANGRAYTTGASAVWQTSGSVYKDYRFAFSGKLHVNGPNGSCARMRVISKFDDGSISKRFPAAGDGVFGGYYSYCQADGKGEANVGGADISTATTRARVIQSADVSICYAPNSQTPNTQCYNFTINRGD